MTSQAARCMPVILATQEAQLWGSQVWDKPGQLKPHNKKRWCLVIECLPSILRALSSVPSIKKFEKVWWSQSLCSDSLCSPNSHSSHGLRWYCLWPVILCHTRPCTCEFMFVKWFRQYRNIVHGSCVSLPLGCRVVGGEGRTLATADFRAEPSVCCAHNRVLIYYQWESVLESLGK